MPANVTVAVFIDRGLAIRSGRNRWGWVQTELDLDVLDSEERAALAECPESKGVTKLTHTLDGWRDSDKDNMSWMRRAAARESFCREWEDGPSPIEANSETALAAVRHLASARKRRVAVAQTRMRELELLAHEKATSAEETVRTAVIDLDVWLATPADNLVTESGDENDSSRRFKTLGAPHRLEQTVEILIASLKEPVPKAFSAEWEVAAYTLATNGKKAPERRGLFDLLITDTFHTIDDPEDIKTSPCPSLIGDAETLIRSAYEERKVAIRQHWLAVSEIYWRKVRDFEQAQQDAIIQRTRERRAAMRARFESTEAAENSAGYEELLSWAQKHNHHSLVSLVKIKASKDDISAALRATIFDPLEPESPRYKKITKTDLMIGNPGFRDDVRALDATFEEEEAELRGEEEAKAYGRLVSRLLSTEAPAQFRIRRHRGTLKRHDVNVGVPVEVRSVLVQVIFGPLRISRAFALGGLTPIE